MTTVDRSFAHENNREFHAMCKNMPEGYTCVVCKDTTTVEEIQKQRTDLNPSWWKLLPCMMPKDDGDGEEPMCFWCCAEVSGLDPEFGDS